MSLYRFPVFLLGVYAGVLASRNHDKLLPWPRSVRLFFLFCCTSHTAEPYSPEKDQASWRKTADILSIVLPTLTLLCGYSDFAIKMKGSTWYPHVWLQLIVAWPQLWVMIALTRDGGQSWASRFLRSNPLVWLGKISASLYLVHEVLLWYVVWATRGQTLPMPDFTGCRYPDGTPEKEACVVNIKAWLAKRSLEPWAIPIVIAVSFLGAAILFYGFEVGLTHACPLGTALMDRVVMGSNPLILFCGNIWQEPIRKWLKKDKKKPQEPN